MHGLKQPLPPLEVERRLPWDLRWLGFWVQDEAGEPARLLRARVRGMRVEGWERCAPPWSAEAPPSGLGLVVQLGAWEPLTLAPGLQRQLARGPLGARSLRTSRLSLERARRPDELLLVSDADWRAYEEAAARGEAPRVVREDGRRRLKLAGGEAAELAGRGRE